MYCLIARGQWVVQLLQCTATLPGGWGLSNSCNGLPHCVEAVGSGTPTMRKPTRGGGGGSLAQEAVAAQRAVLLQCTATLPGAVGSGTAFMHCHTAQGQWVVENVQCIASLPRGSGQWNSCNTPLHYLGQWAVQLLQCTVSLPGCTRQCNSYNVLPLRLGAVGSGTDAVRGPTS